MWLSDISVGLSSSQKQTKIFAERRKKVAFKKSTRLPLESGFIRLRKRRYLHRLPGQRGQWETEKEREGGQMNFWTLREGPSQRPQKLLLTKFPKEKSVSCWLEGLFLMSFLVWLDNFQEHMEKTLAEPLSGQRITENYANENGTEIPSVGWELPSVWCPNFGGDLQPQFLRSNAERQFTKLKTGSKGSWNDRRESRVLLPAHTCAHTCTKLSSETWLG